MEDSIVLKAIFRGKGNSITKRLLKKGALLFVAIFALALTPFSFFANAFAEEGNLPAQPLGAIDYLDYQLSSPEYLYADDDVVVVSSNKNLVFFYDGKIYNTALRSDGEILRDGNFIYYFHHSLLYKTELGVFEEVNVTDQDGEPIAVSSFGIKNGRLVTVNSSGAQVYQDFAKQTENPADKFNGDFDTDLLKASNVYVGNNDFFSVAGEIYKDGKFVKGAKANYMTELDGELYYSNKEGIFHLGDDAPVYSSLTNGNHTVLDICAYKDTLLFIDGTSFDLMQIEKDGTNLRKFIFDVEIKTTLGLSFVENPITVRIAEQTKLHAGYLSNGAFYFTGSEITKENKDWVKLGSIDGYALIYGYSESPSTRFKMGKYALVQESLTAEIDQNMQITFDKGVILHDCQMFSTLVANEETTISSLKKNSQVMVKSAFTMNGVNYLLVQTENQTGFVLSGEVTKTLIDGEHTTFTEQGSVTGKNNTTVAIVIILISTSVFILTLFISLAKKEYVKL